MMPVRTLRIWTWVGLASASGLGACSTPDEPTVSLVRDSVGITVVESVQPVWEAGAGWTVEPVPALDLGRAGSGPAYDFYEVTDAERLPDGSIAVADDGSDEVRLFSPTGEHQRTVGRDGDGPGEFQRLDQVWRLPGDSLVAYDFWAARVTVFSPEGSVARVTTISDAGRPRPLYPLGEGGYVGMSTDFSGFGDEIGPRRWRNPMLRLDSAGAVLDTLVSIQGYESVVFSGGDAVALWGKHGHLAVHEDDIYVGSADGVEFRVLSRDGDVRRIVGAPGYDLRLTATQIGAELDAWFPDSVELSAVSREIRDAQPTPTHRPGYESMVVDDSGYTWLQSYEARHEGGDPTKWLVFDPAGQWLGVVTLPSRFEVFRVGSDWILGKRRDEFDVEHVQVLTLRRGGTTAGEETTSAGR